MVSPGVVFASFVINPASIGAKDSNDETATVAGLRTGHPVVVWAPDLEDKVSLSNAHCSAANTLKFRLGNHNADAAVDPASQTMYVVQF
jgi:hypothetical protein